jgi:hypothetical protein
MSLIWEDYGLRQVLPGVVAGMKTIACEHVVDSLELVGIEVEVENAGNLTANLNKTWTMVADGSLRNTGIELITKPIPAKDAPLALEYLLKHYLTQDCCFSPRTSVHVHLNVQDLTRGQVVDYILLYAVYEKLFYKFAGRGRAKNIYCVPLSDCDLLTYMCEMGETRDRQWSKYTGLNTLPILTYGTVEFRHMHGTYDVGKLSTWINLITKLKEYIKGSTSKQIRGGIADMNDGFDFQGLMHEIWGKYAGAFKYDGPEELNYLQAKQALAARSNVRLIQNAGTKTSLFYSFKG